ncbi:MAG: hypothetical protein KAR40_13975 [Candidatus Sabulitectum sp.]|nr:hypothetical protein [Candidatus Sabulitectum sp.]
MATIFKKLVVAGKTMKIFSIGTTEQLQNGIKKLLVLKGVEVAVSSPEEFLEYYKKRFVSLPDIGNN